jgi:hypothetical protein
MKIIQTFNGFCISNDQGVILDELPTFFTEQDAANWVVRITSDLLDLVAAIKFNTSEGDDRQSATKSTLSFPKPGVFK